MSKPYDYYRTDFDKTMNAYHRKQAGIAYGPAFQKDPTIWPVKGDYGAYEQYEHFVPLSKTFQWRTPYDQRELNLYNSLAAKTQYKPWVRKDPTIWPVKGDYAAYEQFGDNELNEGFCACGGGSNYSGFDFTGKKKY